MQPSLKTILKKSIDGKTRYQSLLYDRFAPMVLGICRRYASSDMQADDMFQEAFMKVFEKLKQVKNASALPGWIKQIVINTCLDCLKLEKRAWITPVEDIELNDQFYSELLDRLSTEQLMKIVNELPEGYRTVLNLSIVDGYSHKEIATKLNIVESTSRSQLTYAKKLLKEKLSKLKIGKYESVI